MFPTQVPNDPSICGYNFLPYATFDLIQARVGAADMAESGPSWEAAARDGHHGPMLYLEIQEGAAAMALKRYQDEVAPASATGVRMALGATGRLEAHREGRFLCCVCFH